MLTDFSLVLMFPIINCCDHFVMLFGGKMALKYTDIVGTQYIFLGAIIGRCMHISVVVWYEYVQIKVSI